MIKNFKVHLFILLTFLLCNICSKSASADVGAAPVYSQGGILQSSSPNTNVSMDYESVTITYSNPERKYSSIDGTEFDASMPAHVAAAFHMTNNSDQEEKMKVYFPSNDSLFAGGWGGDDITSFKVNGKSLTEENKTNIPITIAGKEEQVLSYQWEETFPPQQTTQISIEYDTKSGKNYQFYILTYVLGTGRGWQGKIKEGEITFVLPEDLTSYSVVSKLPLVKENKLPFKVSGNKVTVNFSQFEPDTEDAIILGVYEFEIVKEIEQLKENSGTFSNILEIANLFRKLSGGPHCSYCTGKASDLAREYYDLAINKASSEEELNSVLKIFAYGEGDWGNANELIGMMSFAECETDDYECKSSIYFERDKLGDTPFRIHIDKGEIQEKNFLLNYAEKMKTLNSSTASIVQNFVDESDDIFAYWKEQNPGIAKDTSPTQAQQEPSPSPSTEEATTPLKTSSYTVPLIITAVVLVTAGLALLIIKKRKKVKPLETTTLPQTENQTPDMSNAINSTKEETKTEEKNKSDQKSSKNSPTPPSQTPDSS